MIRTFLGITVSLFLADVASAALPSPDDFAFGMPLAVSEREAVHEFDLPEPVYRAAAETINIGIFNSGGEIVPFRVFPPAATESAREKVTLPFFPIPSTELEGDPLSVLVQRGPAGEVISVQTRPAGRQVSAYLVDTTGIPRGIQALEIDWRANSSMVAKIRIEGSDDLTRWQTLADGETVAKVQYGSHRLERRTVQLGQVRPYLRLSLDRVPESFRLEGVRVTLAPATTDPPRRHLTVLCRKIKADEFVFSFPGPYPIDRLKIKTPQPNTIVQGTFFSRSAESDPWTQRTIALLYNLTVGGATLTNPEVAVGPSGDRFWLLRVSSEGGGMGEGLPEVEVGWIPHRVRFIARGSAPFLLAYGSSRQDLSQLQADAVLLRLTAERTDLPVAKVETGPEKVLAGERAFKRKMSPQDWKAALLWVALVLSVIFLAGMAFTFYRQMDRKCETGDDQRKQS